MASSSCLVSAEVSGEVPSAKVRNNPFWLFVHMKYVFFLFFGC